jgi:hypothetical protein
MGLDMYLQKHIYVQNWEHNPEKHEVIVKLNGDIRPDIDPKNITYIIEEVGYWRKFNALHNWFVVNCSDDGEDNCKDIYVQYEKLNELIKILQQVKKDHKKAHELLPTKDGFFFGDTDYDDYYFSEVTRTLKILNKLKKSLGKKYDYPTIIYKASW